MSSFIPLSGLISDILAFAALITNWGQGILLWLGLSWFVKAGLTNALADDFRMRRPSGNLLLLASGLAQDVVIAVAIYALAR